MNIIKVWQSLQDETTWKCVLAGILLISLLSMSDSYAATINVDETSVGSGIGVVVVDNTDNLCSLPEAIRAAQSNSVVDACTAGDDQGNGPGITSGDVIVLPMGSTFTFDGINPQPFRTGSDGNDFGLSALPVITEK